MLNPKQEQFCFEYAKSGCAGASYQKVYGTSSGASASANANRLLKNDNVRIRLQEIQAELASSRIMDAKEIQERLTKIGRGEVSEEIFLSNGERTQRQTSIRDSLRALEILARIQGLFVIKQEVNLKATPVVIAGGDCLED